MSRIKVEHSGHFYVSCFNRDHFLLLFYSYFRKQIMIKSSTTTRKMPKINLKKLPYFAYEGWPWQINNKTYHRKTHHRHCCFVIINIFYLFFYISDVLAAARTHKWQSHQPQERAKRHEWMVADRTYFYGVSPVF